MYFTKIDVQTVGNTAHAAANWTYLDAPPFGLKSQHLKEEASRNARCSGEKLKGWEICL